MMKKNVLIFGLLIMGLFILAQCDDSGNNDDGNTEHGDPPAAIEGQLFVNGAEVTGKTIRDPNQGDRLKLRAHFSDPQGNETIRIAFARYSHHRGMMQHMGDYTLWDDGTHGDEIAGDGWYCYEGEIGNMMSMMGVNWGHHWGMHEYEFYCYDYDDNESNHLTVGMDIQ